MKGPLLSLSLTTLLFLQGIAVSGTTNKKNFVPRNNKAYEQEALRQREAKKRDFEPARQLLLEKGVPFEPDVLLEEDWPTKLAPMFAQMPEMQITRYHKEPLKGAQFADTLYLPEYVKLEGDTIILAKHIVFEGKDVIIRGNYSLHFLPIESEGVMGTTLKELRDKRKKELRAQGVRTPVEEFPREPLLNKGGHITIDLHGEGYKEWLEKHGGEKGVAELVKKAQRGEVSVQTVIGRQADPGAMGIPGSAAAPAAPANPIVANKGEDGVCGDTTTATGGQGALGADGGNGNPGGAGGPGNRGNDGTPYLGRINDGDTMLYDIYTNGGMGGKGGPGAPGSPGAPGGTGGEGGTGATCQCSEGRAGTGGKGGTAGWGGRGGQGGKGGKGGNGGDGKDITLSVPCNYDPSRITAHTGGGGAGSGGDGASGGQSGTAGTPGARGTPGTNFYCASSNGRYGAGGDPGDSLGPTPATPASDPGDLPGASGGLTLNYRCVAECDWCNSQQMCTTHGCISPIAIDIQGNGFDFTDAQWCKFRHCRGRHPYESLLDCC